MKKRIFSIVFVICMVVAILAVPLAPVLYGFVGKPQFQESYYGELSDMYKKLSLTEGKKIVIIGTSGVAFGVNSRQIENDLKRMGLEYSVCNFGLYGALGTKLMLDLSENCLSEGDIVVIVPEIDAQEMTLYFSAEHVWRAMDGNFSMLTRIKKENRSAMVGGFAKFVSQKYVAEKKDEPLSGNGVYRKDSFDENCDMIYERAYNVMLGGADTNFPIRFSTEQIADDFIDYLNAYNTMANEKKAKVVYSYPAMNAAGIDGADSESDLQAFHSYLREKLNFRIISDPTERIMDKEWFYDSNFHLNSSGAIYYSHRLTKDILTELSVSEEYVYTDPMKPSMPENNDMIDEEMNNEFSAYFEYEEHDDGYRIVGLKESGKALKEIVLPYSYNGKKINSYAAETFNDCAALEQLTLQKNIRNIPDHSFVGTPALTKLILKDFSAEKCTVGAYLFEENSVCRIYVSKEYYTGYLSDYFWSHYSERIVKAE